MKALSPDKGKHTPVKATAALPQAVIPNEARTRSFDEQMDAYEAVSERAGSGPGAIAALPQAVIPLPYAVPESLTTVAALPQAVIPLPYAAPESLATVAALPQAVIPLPYLGGAPRPVRDTGFG